MLGEIKRNMRQVDIVRDKSFKINIASIQQDNYWLVKQRVPFHLFFIYF